MRVTPFLVLVAVAGPAAAQFPEPPKAVDINPADDIVEIELTAAETTWQFKEGVDTTVWAYNGSVPGPTIEAKVGDTLVVHVTNDLEEATTVHWHGVELDAIQDGSHISQLHIQPGETFTYTIELLHDATYWYHPHVRTNDQVERGLHGVLIVRDPAKDVALLGPTAFEEHLIVFDDVLLDAEDQIVPAFEFTDPLSNALMHVNGREGNLLLVNGKDTTNAPINMDVTNGVPQRWRVVNVANTTIARIGINDPVEGLASQLYAIGNDSGYSIRPRARKPVVQFGSEHPTSMLLLKLNEGIYAMSGQRMDVVFTPIGTDGERFTVFQNDWVRGRHIAMYGSGGQVMLPDDPLDGLNPPVPYLTLTLQGSDPGAGEYVPSFVNPMPPIPDPHGVLPMAFGHTSPDTQGNVVLFAQGMGLPASKVDSFVAHDVAIGGIYDWEVTNLTHGDHPFHVHGFFFELVDIEFQDDLDPTANYTFVPPVRTQRDTFRLPARGDKKGTSRSITRLRMRVEPGNRDVVAMGHYPTMDIAGNWTSGGWLVHCHILEHSAKGMLSFYEVRDPADPFVLLGKFLPGTNGNSYLTARGDLSPSSDVLFDVVNALPGTQVALLLGSTAQRLPFGGGELVPSFDLDVLVGTTDTEGVLTLPWSGWEALPSGTEVYAQAAFVDPLGGVPVLNVPNPASGVSENVPSAASGKGGFGEVPREGAFALTNALSFRTP